MNKKIFSIIGVILLIGLIYIGFSSTCALKKTKQLEGEIDKVAEKQEEFSDELEEVTDQRQANEIKTWIEYKNEKYGYSIKYPEGMKIYPKELSLMNEEITLLHVMSIRTDRGDAFIISTHRNILQLTPEEYYKKFTNENFESVDCIEELEKKDLKIKSFSGVEFISTEADGNYRHIIINGDNPKLMYTIYYPLYTTEKNQLENESMKDLFETIFSTFSDI